MFWSTDKDDLVKTENSGGKKRETAESGGKKNSSSTGIINQPWIKNANSTKSYVPGTARSFLLCYFILLYGYGNCSQGGGSPLPKSIWPADCGRDRSQASWVPRCRGGGQGLHFETALTEKLLRPWKLWKLMAFFWMLDSTVSPVIFSLEGCCLQCFFSRRIVSAVLLPQMQPS